MCILGIGIAKEQNSNLEIEPSIFFQLFESDGRSVTDLNVKFQMV